MVKKYEFTDEVNEYGHKRIRALRDIPRYNVKAGDLGGFLESEKNLSHNDDCWVAVNARVSGNAKVSGNAFVFCNARIFDNAFVSGNAKVYGNAEVFGNARVYGNAIVTKNPVVISGLQYLVTITDTHMQIGCQFHTFEDWNNFTDKDIIVMDGKEALNFGNEHKDILMIFCNNHNKE